MNIILFSKVNIIFDTTNNQQPYKTTGKWESLGKVTMNGEEKQAQIVWCRIEI